MIAKPRARFSSLRKRARANAIAEAPVAIWFAFMGLFFPLVCLVTCLLRYAFLVTTAHEAVYQAALSKTFSTDVSPTDRSAINSANDTALNVAQNFTGITVSSVSTQIVRSDSQTSDIQVYTTRLPVPADTTRYVYLLETTVVGSIMPIVPGQSGVFGAIQGLTAPIVVQSTSRKIAENPQGLNL